MYVQRNGLANTRLKYAMKFNSFVRKSSTDVNEPRRITFRMITPKITSIWFSHELCFGRYTNRIRWLDSDKNACRLATDFSTPRTPFLPSAVVDFTRLGHQLHQALRAMDVQVIHHEHPRTLRVGGHRLLDVAGEVGLRPRRTDRRPEQFPGRHHEVADQAQRPVPLVLELDPFGTSPRSSALLGAIRSSACMPVISSTQTVWVRSVRSRSGAARYVSQTALTCSSNRAGSFSVVLSQYRLLCGCKAASRR